MLRKKTWFCINPPTEYWPQNLQKAADIPIAVTCIEPSLPKYTPTMDSFVREMGMEYGENGFSLTK